jgi:hypothetical protein
LDDGRGEIPLNDFEPLDLEELPSQTVFPAHPGADQTTAFGREGMAATKHVLLERCEMREEDGKFRSIREHAGQPAPINATLR